MNQFRNQNVYKNALTDNQMLLSFNQTLSFMHSHDRNQNQEILLLQFQKKLAQQMLMSQTSFYQEIQNNLGKQLSSILLKMYKGNFQDKRMQILVDKLLKNSSKQINQIWKVALFYVFIKKNIDKYRLLLKQFQDKNIMQSVNFFHKSKILNCKILSSILLIYWKYNEKYKYCVYAKECIQVRKQISSKQNLHLETTIYFQLKLIEWKIQLHPQFQKENNCSLKLFKQYFQSIQHLLNQTNRQVCQNQINRIYNILNAKTSHKKQQTVRICLLPMKQNKTIFPKLQQNNQCVIQQKNLFVDMNNILKIPSKRTINFHKKSKKSIFQKIKDLQYKINKKHQKQIIFDDKLKSIQQQIFTKQRRLFSIYKQKNNKKSQQKIRQKFFTRYSKQKQHKYSTRSFSLCRFKQKTQQKHIVLQSSENKNKQLNFQQNSKTNIIFDIENKIKNQNQVKCFSKQTINKNIQSSNVLKKKSTRYLYKTLLNKNHIAVAPSINQLQTQMKKVQQNQLSDIGFSSLLFQQIITFQIGFEKKNAKDLISPQKLKLSFIKVWECSLKVCFVQLNFLDKNFVLNININGKQIKIVSPIRSNILCQKYNTLWPTLRYLLRKKISSLNILKDFFNQIFVVNLSPYQVDNKFYEAFCGKINQKQIIQIDTFIDSCFKFAMLYKYYQKSTNETIFSNTLHHQYLIDKHIEKSINSYVVQQLSLSAYPYIYLFTFIVKNDNIFYGIRVQTTSLNVAAVTNYQANLQVKITLIDILSLKQLEGIKINKSWADLQSQLITLKAYLNYVKITLKRQSKGRYWLKLHTNPKAFINKFYRWINKHFTLKKQVKGCKIMLKQQIKIKLQQLFDPISYDKCIRSNYEVQAIENDNANIQLTTISNHNKKTNNISLEVKYGVQKTIYTKKIKIRSRHYYVHLQTFSSNSSTEWYVQYCVFDFMTNQLDKIILTKTDYECIFNKKQRIQQTLISFIQQLSFIKCFSIKKLVLTHNQTKYVTNKTSQFFNNKKSKNGYQSTRLLTLLKYNKCTLIIKVVKIQKKYFLLHLVDNNQFNNLTIFIIAHKEKTMLTGKIKKIETLQFLQTKARTKYLNTLWVKNDFQKIKKSIKIQEICSFIKVISKKQFKIQNDSYPLFENLISSDENYK